MVKKTEVDPIEVTALYGENYHASPTDKFIMARMECSLRGHYWPGGPHTMTEVYEGLQAKCVSMVKDAIRKATDFSDDGGL